MKSIDFSITVNKPIIRKMATWNKVSIILENGEKAEAQSPLIVSASRSTDIPAFYCDWFFHRMKIGYSAWTNPFNGVKSYVSYHNCRFIVFWSKNPRNLLPYLDELKERGIGCYVQYSLNDYEQDGLEKNVPSLQFRIETFKLLVDKLGVGGVIWRFDPLVLTDSITIDTLLSRIERIGDELKGYTNKLVFSFADILAYRKVEANLKKANIPYHEWTTQEMIEFAQRLVKLNRTKGWNYELATCGEAANLAGIQHNKCVDDNLIIKRAYRDRELMKFLKVEIKPMPTADLFGNSEELPLDAIDLGNGFYATHGQNGDKGQRQFCGCIASKDIGEYNTCVHECEYCYANTSKQNAAINYKSHKENPYSETITGR